MIAVAPSLAEVVRCVGGWLIDQALAGWDVAVVTAERADERALRILGVTGCSLDRALAVPLVVPLAGSCLGAVALSADMYASDERIRRIVAVAAEANGAEIRLWGDAWPDDFDLAAPAEYELSRAARAFKAQALTAASSPAHHDATEVFRRGELRSPVLAAVR